jgi:nitrous oxidase accessory protein
MSYWNSLQIIIFCFPFSLHAAPPLQALLDNAETGAIIDIPPGIYSGPVFIEAGITLDGHNQVTIDGQGKGTVVVIDADGAQLRNLRITHSGKSHNDIDSCVQVRGNFNIIKDNVLDNCLFGVDLQQSNNNIVRRNKISSRAVDLGQRGDAVRLWYSMNNQIIGNHIENSRDTVVWYSKDNLIADNHASGGRYALHFMYSQRNSVKNNRYVNNSVGIFLMYSDDVEVIGNYIAHATGVTGVGIGFKETSNVILRDNTVLYCASGIYLDVSPYQPDTVNVIENNTLAYNDSGILFHSDWAGNEIKNNRFQGNITQVAVNGPGSAQRNVWQGNYWDDYEGFDRNHDGIGDTPYQLYAYADRLWMEHPKARFFKASPILEVLDFLERLAPFSAPRLILQDTHPIK